MDGEGEMKSECETKEAPTERALRESKSDSPVRWPGAPLVTEDEAGNLSCAREKTGTQLGRDAPFTGIDDETPDDEEGSGAWWGETSETRSGGVYLLIA